MTGELTAQLRALQRAIGRRRRLLAAGLAAAAVACALTAVQPAAAETVPVLVAVHDLPAGSTVGGGDVRTAAYPSAAVPAGVLRAPAQATGRVLAGAVRTGEALTDVRFVGRALLAALGGDDLVATPVRIADAEAVRILQPGDLVDVLAATPPGAGDAATTPPAGPVAEAVRVIAVPVSDEAGDGALVLLATDRDTAARLAAAAVTARLSVTLRGG